MVDFRFRVCVPGVTLIARQRIGELWYRSRTDI